MKLWGICPTLWEYLLEMGITFFINEADAFTNVFSGEQEKTKA